jgi:protease-4
MDTPPPILPPPLQVAPPAYQTAPRKKGNGCLWTALILMGLTLLGCLGLFFLAFAGSVSSLSGISGTMHVGGLKKHAAFREVLLQEGSGDDRIALINLAGVISSTPASSGFLATNSESMVDSLKRQLAQAAEDDRVKAVLLRIDSPGGEVTASDTIYNAVRRLAARKPVVVHMDSVAASGGYYIACGAKRIVASETTLTGSIGVIMQGISYHGLLDKVGMGTNTFTSGKFKDTLSGARPMREDERLYIQELVNGSYKRFVSIVSQARRIPEETLVNGVADGRIMSGRQALEAGLVDQVGYLEDALELARREAGAPGAMMVGYERAPVSVGELFGMQSAAKGKLEVTIPGASALTELLPGRMYYLPANMTK